MSDDILKGGALAAAGSLEGAAGDILDRDDLRLKGAAKQVKGRAQEALGKLKNKAGDVGDQVSLAAAQVKDQAKVTYKQAADRVTKVANEVDPFVREKPYAAVGLGVAAGLLIGLLLAGRGPKIVYIKPPRV